MAELAKLYTTSLTNAIKKHALVLDYGAAFHDLWDEAGDGSPTILSKLEENQDRFVIVWDGEMGQTSPEKSEKLLTDHLTPLDWALAFSIKMLGDGNAFSPQSLRIHIIDLTGKKHDEWSLRMRHTLLAEMPWVTLHAPLLPTTADGTRATYRDGYGSIVHGLCELLQIDKNGVWLLNKSLGRSPLPSAANNLVDLARQWAATLTHSDDHHDVNNVIGPGLLARDGNSESGYVRAMICKLRWFGVEARYDEWESWPAADAVNKSLFGRPLSIFVIDDQLKRGWGRFVCRLVGQPFDNSAFDSDVARNAVKKINVGQKQEQTVNIYGSFSPELLIGYLESSSSFNKRNYCSQITQSDTVNPEIVFLDLRLYSDVETAKKQASRLVAIARTKMRAPLAWHPITGEELDRISLWCEGKANGQRTPDEALLLLPRLLALAIPLTPIILFSSTSQSWIRERLKPYQNIITGFEKPRVLSNPEAVEAAIASLHYGLDQAVGMMRLRMQLAHAQQAIARAVIYRPNCTRLNKQHIEIYVDETKALAEGITSGLAFCVYPDRKTANGLQTLLWQEHQKLEGGVWAKNKNIGQQSRLSKGAEIRRNETICESQVGKVVDVLGRTNLTIEERRLWSVVATRVPPENPNRHSETSLAAFPDGPLDVALRFNLEFALFVLIPYFLADNLEKFDGSISVCLPTRLVPLRNRSMALNLALAFDMPRPRQDDDSMWMLSTSSKENNLGTGFPLVRGWLHDWRMFARVQPSRIISIQTTVLGRGTNGGITPNEAAARRLFHDIADWACSASEKVPSHGQWIWPLRNELSKVDVFPNWFTSTDSRPSGKKHRRFEQDSRDAILLMAALREGFADGSLHDRENDSIRLMLRNSNIKNCDNRLLQAAFCAPQRIILWSLRHDLGYADGRMLHALLAETMGAAKQEPPQATSAQDHSVPTWEIVGDGVLRAEGLSEHQSGIDAQSDDRPDSSLITSDATAVDEPETLSEEDLFSSHPEGKKFKIVMAPTRSGDIMLNELHINSMRASFRAYSREIALQLGGEGWAEPKTIWGIQSSETGGGTISVTLVAGLLANGDWRCFT